MFQLVDLILHVFPRVSVGRPDDAQAEGRAEGLHVEDGALHRALLCGPGQLPRHLRHESHGPLPVLPGHHQGRQCSPRWVFFWTKENFLYQRKLLSSKKKAGIATTESIRFFL